MAVLLMRAFGASIDQIVADDRERLLSPQPFYDVAATMPPATTTEQFQAMLQNLLIERFHLAFHRDIRDFPGYVLVVDKNGFKLKEVTPDPNPVTDSAAFANAKSGMDGFPIVPGPRTFSQGGSTGRLRVKYQETTMAQFAANLGFSIGISQGRPASQGFPHPRVQDKTGIPGAFTFVLQYYSAGEAGLAGATRALRDSTAGDGGLAAMPDDPAGGAYPDLFTAVKKQLGLALEKTADIPTEVIVIERLERKPVEN